MSLRGIYTESNDKQEPAKLSRQFSHGCIKTTITTWGFCILWNMWKMGNEVILEGRRSSVNIIAKKAIHHWKTPKILQVKKKIIQVLLNNKFK